VGLYGNDSRRGRLRLELFEKGLFGRPGHPQVARGDHLARIRENRFRFREIGDRREWLRGFENLEGQRRFPCFDRRGHPGDSGADDDEVENSGRRGGLNARFLK
jgi:hypothetical protein